MSRSNLKSYVASTGLLAELQPDLCSQPSAFLALSERGGAQTSTKKKKHWSGRESLKMAMSQEWITKGDWAVGHLDRSWGLISLSWVAWRTVYDVERPETPNDSRNISNDVSRSISKSTCLVWLGVEDFANMKGKSYLISILSISPFLTL